MITIDEEGNLIFSMDSRFMDVEEIVEHFLAMTDEEFDAAFDAVTVMTEAWNEAQDCRAKDGRGH